MKVIGIKDNYNKTQNKPTIFFMADSSLLKDGKPFFKPEFAEKFVAHPSLVVHICRLGKNISRKFANRYYNEVTVGLCVEAIGMKDKFEESAPGAYTNAFDGAAVLGEFVPVEKIENFNNSKYSVSVNGEEKCSHSISELNIDIDGLIEHISKYFTLKIGDILFTGYGEQNFELNINDNISGTIDNNEVLNFKIK